MPVNNHALIVVDVQNDFCPGGALAVQRGDSIIPEINSLLRKFPLCVFTQDWHPANHVSFAQNHTERDVFSTIELPYGDQILWPAHCVQGTKGAEFHHALESIHANAIIRKGFQPQIDSYSGFFENDRQTPTGLEGYLRSRHITHITITGLATDFCVAYTALDARKLGFEVTVKMSACRAIDLNGSLASACSKMNDAGVDLL